MKINKFNENTNNSWNNWSIEKFNKISKMQKEYHRLDLEIKDYNRELSDYFKEYLFLNPQLQENEDNELELEEMIILRFNVIDRSDPYYVKYVLESKDYLELEYFLNSEDEINGYSNSAWFTKKDVEDFINFMENPETYKDAKKYNL